MPSRGLSESRQTFLSRRSRSGVPTLSHKRGNATGNHHPQPLESRHRDKGSHIDAENHCGRFTAELRERLQLFSAD
jgi:hypothetical protein